jgi:SAM-dependent methyltransferase
MDWTSGYRADIDYTYGYYRELAPGMIDFALMTAGLEPPPRSGGISYLELGFGQGLSANIIAAANPGVFWGADFNPSHAAHARSLASASQADARFVDDSFAELLDREDLPGFEYVALHGVWSWVSDENRAAIVRIIRRRLKVGGAVYISYNTLPGWAVAMPLRHMLTLHAETAGSDVQGVLGRIDAAIAFGSKLSTAGARYFAANPQVGARLESIASQNRNYLAHEYFNRDWAPMYFSDANQRLEEAKLSYGAAAHVLEQIDSINLTPAQSELLGGLPKGDLRETVRDYLVNQQFRRDVFTRGARQLSLLERLERLKKARVVLTVPASEITFQVEGAMGKIGLREDIYAPLVAVLADGAPRTIGELAAEPTLKALTADELIQAVAVLVGGGGAHTANTDADIETAAPRTRRLNAQLISRARGSGDIGHLASPVTGGGVAVARFEQMFLGARAQGAKTPQAWAEDAWSVLVSQNQAIIKNGAVLATPEENLAELRDQARVFADTRLTVLRRLRIAD